MAKYKEWYEVKVKCIKEAPGISMKLGEVITIAKVRSKGNTYVVMVALRNKFYNQENFEVYAD